MLVSYHLQDGVASLTMDDGKVNAFSPAMFSELHAALDRAAADRAVVVLRGRDGIFSAGLDLVVLRAGGAEATALVGSGFELAERLLSFPTPVVAACTGHAVAMGMFLLQSADYRIGAVGPYAYRVNEVALGLRLPRTGVAILRDRLTPAAFNRAATLAEPFTPDNAVGAGILDRVVNAAELDEVAHATAVTLAGLNLSTHEATKRQVRRQLLRFIRTAIEEDYSAPG